jgi:hypothetical protein
MLVVLESYQIYKNDNVSNQLTTLRRGVVDRRTNEYSEMHIAHGYYVHPKV